MPNCKTHLEKTRHQIWRQPTKPWRQLGYQPEINSNNALPLPACNKLPATFGCTSAIGPNLRLQNLQPQHRAHTSASNPRGCSPVQFYCMNFQQHKAENWQTHHLSTNKICTRNNLHTNQNLFTKMGHGTAHYLGLTPHRQHSWQDNPKFCHRTTANKSLQPCSCKPGLSP